MDWKCASSKGVGELPIFNGVMTKEHYKNILKNELKKSVFKFAFVDPRLSRKVKYVS